MTKKLIVFDLDNTLTEGNSWARLNVGLGMTPDEDLQLSEEYYRAQKFTEWATKVIHIYNERGTPTKKNIEKILATFRYTVGAEKCVREVKELGYTIAILSGAPDLFTKLICKDLDIHNFKFINTLVFDGNDLLVDILTEGEEKLVKLNSYKDICKSLNTDLKQAVIVGDGDNEELLFDVSSHSVTFKGSNLEDKAWKIINTLTDLPGILREIPEIKDPLVC